jgi:nucleoid-associated protein YgaU
LAFATLLSVDNVEFWDVLDLPTIPVNADDLFYTVITGDRIDTIAAKFYGDPVLWWVIAAANDMEIIPTDLNEGTQIRIPSPTYVNQVLFKQAGGISLIS